MTRFQKIYFFTFIFILVGRVYWRFVPVLVAETAPATAPTTLLLPEPPAAFSPGGGRTAVFIEQQEQEEKDQK